MGRGRGACLEWVTDRAAELGSKPVLVTNSHSPSGVPALTRFQWGTTWFSRLSAGTAWNAPVLSYVPHGEDLEYALGIARNAAIDVVETVSCPVGGWAAEVGALNLFTGQATAPHTDRVQELLKRLAFYGNNGYGDQFGKKMAPGIVDELVATEEIDAVLIPSALAAHHVSARGRARIATMLDERGRLSGAGGRRR